MVLLVLISSVFAVSAEGATVSTNQNSNVQVVQAPAPDNSGLIEAIREAISKIKALFESIELLFTEGLIGIINRTVGDILNGALSAVTGVFGKVYLVTPSLVSMPFVKKPWSIIVLISIALTGLAIIITVARVLVGDGNGEKGKKGIKALLIAVAFILTTLFLTEASILMQNYVWESIISESMPDLIGEQYSSLYEIPGDMVMKIAYSSYETSIEDLQMLDISDVFLNPQNGSLGGVLGLIFSMTLLIITGWLGLFRILILIMEADISPAYLVGGALMGDQRPQAGIANLLFRSITLQSVFVGGWYLMVIFSRDQLWANFFYDIGVSPVLINIIIQLLILVASYFYWLRPHIRAVREPLTLAGGEVIKSFGNVMGGISKIGGNISQNMGWVQGESAAIKGQEKADKIKDLGNRIKANNFDLNIDKIVSSAGGRVTNEEIMTSMIKENGSQVVKEDHEFYLGQVPKENLNTLVKTMEKKLPKGAFKIDPENNLLEIKDQYYDQAVDVIKDHNFIKENNSETKLIGSDLYKEIEVPISSMQDIKEYIQENKKIDANEIRFDQTKPNKINIRTEKYDEVLKELKQYDFVKGLDMEKENIKEVTSIKEWKEVEMPQAMLSYVKQQLEVNEKIDKADYVFEDNFNKVAIHPSSYTKVMTEIKKIVKEKIPYWTKGSKYVVYEQGMPVLYKNPPEDGIEFGPWKKENR